MTALEILEYEVRASWWADAGGLFIWPRPIASLATKWFAFKVRRKFARYRKSVAAGAIRSRGAKA